MVYGCRGNYRGESYTSTVSSWDDESKKTWIEAMPNDPASLAAKEKIWMCVTHFEGKWRTVQGGQKPKNPIFPESIPNSSLKQTQSKKRGTKRSSTEVRGKSTFEQDKINSFQEFGKKIKNIYPRFSFVNDGADNNN